MLGSEDEEMDSSREVKTEPCSAHQEVAINRRINTKFF